MLSYVLLAATQLTKAAETMLRQRHFPEPSVTRELASAMCSLYDAIPSEPPGTNVDNVRRKLLHAMHDLLDTLD